MSKRALIVFAREPRLGKVKTRLARRLTTGTVLDLYKAFIKDVLATVLRVRCDKRFIYYTGCRSSGVSFLKKFSPLFVLRRQYGKDLGERMHQAFVHSYKNGFDKTLILGTDCLSLTQKDIRLAFEKLNDFSCVLGPSQDGGYYLIALRVPQKKFFTSIPWGTEEVLQRTLYQAERLTMKTFLLPKKEDIDTIVSLKNFYQTSHRQEKWHSIKVVKKVIQNIN